MGHKLFFFLIGCRLSNRHTEQHDVYFGIGQKVSDLIPALKNFWPEAENFHIDCWREVTNVNGFQVRVFPKSTNPSSDNNLSLFFINLGGYRHGQFEEFHFKDIFVAADQDEAIKLAKKTRFYKEYGFEGAVAHVDNKYGVDIDEIFPIQEILLAEDKSKYQIMITNEIPNQPDEIHLGYTTLSKLKEF